MRKTKNRFRTRGVQSVVDEAARNALLLSATIKLEAGVTFYQYPDGARITKDDDGKWTAMLDTGAFIRDGQQPRKYKNQFDAARDLKQYQCGPYTGHPGVSRIKEEEESETEFVRQVVAAGGQSYKLVDRNGKGHPDRSNYLDGRHWIVEFKAPGKKPDPHQDKRISELKATGALVGVAYTVEEAWAIGGFRTTAPE